MSYIFISMLAVISLAVSYLLTAWFSSTLPQHVFALMKKLGVCKSNTAGWDAFDEFLTTDWQEWLYLYWSSTWKQMFISSLITCPVCLSIHLSFWLGCIISCVIYFFCIASPFIFWLIPLAAAACPMPALILFHLLSKLEK